MEILSQRKQHVGIFKVLANERVDDWSRQNKTEKREIMKKSHARPTRHL